MYAFAGCSLIYKMQLDGDLLKSIGYGAFSSTSMQELTFMFDDAESKQDECRSKIIDAIGYDELSNPNPLELPEDCVIIVKSKGSNVICGKYDYMMNDLMNADIDINRN